MAYYVGINAQLILIMCSRTTVLMLTLAIKIIVTQHAQHCSVVDSSDKTVCMHGEAKTMMDSAMSMLIFFCLHLVVQVYCMCNTILEC